MLIIGYILAYIVDMSLFRSHKYTYSFFTMEKKKIKLELDMKSTPVALLWEYISSAPGLAKWFADDVEVEGKEYTFYWSKLPQTARLTALRQGSHLRLKWEGDEDPKAYFEMRILVSDFSDHVMLSITDFAEPGEEEEQIELWRSQLDTLRRHIGV